MGYAVLRPERRRGADHRRELLLSLQRRCVHRMSQASGPPAGGEPARRSKRGRRSPCRHAVLGRRAKLRRPGGRGRPPAPRLGQDHPGGVVFGLHRRRHDRVSPERDASLLRIRRPVHRAGPCDGAGHGYRVVHQLRRFQHLHYAVHRTARTERGRRSRLHRRPPGRHAVRGHAAVDATDRGRHERPQRVAWSARVQPRRTDSGREQALRAVRGQGRSGRHVLPDRRPERRSHDHGCDADLRTDRRRGGSGVRARERRRGRVARVRSTVHARHDDPLRGRVGHVPRPG